MEIHVFFFFQGELSIFFGIRTYSMGFDFFVLKGTPEQNTTSRFFVAVGGKSRNQRLEKLPSTLTNQDEGIQESLCFPGTTISGDEKFPGSTS